MTQFPAKIWVLSNLDAALGYGGGTAMSFLRLRATVYPAERYPIQGLVNIQSGLISQLRLKLPLLPVRCRSYKVTPLP